MPMSGKKKTEEITKGKNAWQDPDQKRGCLHTNSCDGTTFICQTIASMTYDWTAKLHLRWYKVRKIIFRIFCQGIKPTVLLYLLFSISVNEHNGSGSTYLCGLQTCSKRNYNNDSNFVTHYLSRDGLRSKLLFKTSHFEDRWAACLGYFHRCDIRTGDTPATTRVPHWGVALMSGIHLWIIERGQHFNNTFQIWTSQCAQKSTGYQGMALATLLQKAASRKM